MKLIDRYILKSFARNFLFGLFCFIIIFILVDLFENIDKFIDKNLGFADVLSYYTFFIPEIIKLITPVSVLLSTLFTTSRFIALSEMTSMNSAGISIYRYSLPLLLTGIIITLCSVYFNGWIVPYSNAEKIKIEREKLGKHSSMNLLQNLSLQVSPNTIFTIRNYSETEKSGESVSFQIFSDNSLSDLTERYDAQRARWDSVARNWVFTNVTVRKFDSLGLSSYSYFSELDEKNILPESNINLTPQKISIKQKSPDELVISELRAFIDEMRFSGQNVTRAEVDYYSKTAFPFANIIVIIFGVSLSLNQRKGSAALQFGISILVTFIYLGFIKISQTFGYNGEIPPLLTAWLANILFLSVAIINFARLNLRN